MDTSLGLGLELSGGTKRRPACPHWFIKPTANLLVSLSMPRDVHTSAISFLAVSILSAGVRTLLSGSLNPSYTSPIPPPDAPAGFDQLLNNSGSNKDLALILAGIITWVRYTSAFQPLHPLVRLLTRFSATSSRWLTSTSLLASFPAPRAPVSGGQPTLITSCPRPVQPEATGPSLPPVLDIV